MPDVAPGATQEGEELDTKSVPRADVRIAFEDPAPAAAATEEDHDA